METVEDLKAIWFLVTGLVALVAWSVRLEARVSTTARDLNELKRNVDKQWKVLDQLQAQTAVHDRQLATLTAMMDPANVEQFHRSDERLKAKVEGIEAHVKHLMAKEYKGG